MKRVLVGVVGVGVAAFAECLPDFGAAGAVLDVREVGVVPRRAFVTHLVSHYSVLGHKAMV